MLASEEQISELQNEFSFWKAFQLPKRWKSLKWVSQAFGTKCMAQPHFETLIIPRIQPSYGAQGHPFCSGNWNGDCDVVFRRVEHKLLTDPAINTIPSTPWITSEIMLSAIEAYRWTKTIGKEEG